MNNHSISPRFSISVVFILVVCFTLSLVMVSAIGQEQRNSKVSDRLHQVLVQQQQQQLYSNNNNNNNNNNLPQGDASGNTSNINIWVFFTKRSPNWALLNSREESLSQLDVKAIARRQLKRSEVIQESDQPVDETYVDQVVQMLNDHNYGRIRTKSKWLHAISVTNVTPEEIENIAQLSCVTQVEIVTRFKRPKIDHLEEQNEVQQQQQQQQSPNRRRMSELNYGQAYAQMQQINAIEAHNMGLNGTGLTILVLDSGFRLTHQALKNVQVIDSYDFVNNDTNVDNEATDDPSQFRHGTQCLSLIGGMDYGANPFFGVAFGAKFLLAKTEDVRDESIVEEDNFVRAIEWGEQRGADILSASLGYSAPMYTRESDFDGKTTVTARAVNAAIDRGLICVIAAGNEGPGERTVATPGDAFDAITVGAVDISGNIASFSSRGPTFDGRVKPEVCARGVQAYLVDPASTTAYRAGSGTSFATPIVAGAVALIKQAKPEWGPCEMRKALMATASRSDRYDNKYGWGIINIMKALQYDNDCNGNGFKLDDQCKCYQSFYGSTCAYRRLSCEFGCVNGFCNNDRCECFPGYTGSRCTELIVISEASRSRTHGSPLAYLSLLIVLLIAYLTL